MKKVCKIDICKLKYFKGSTMVSKKTVLVKILVRKLLIIYIIKSYECTFYDN